MRASFVASLVRLAELARPAGLAQLAHLAQLARLASLVAITGVASCGGDEDRTTFFTVWAFEERTSEGGAERPLAGAEIAFDPPGGGERLILNAAADGHATFEGDFTRGRASVTVFDPSHVLVSVIEVSPDTARARPNTLGKPPEDLVVIAPTLDDVIRAETVELRGALLGKRDASTSVDLSTSGIARLGNIDTTGAYALRVPRSRPFFLLGHETKSVASEPANVTNEILASFRIDMPALEADTTRDLDARTATRLVTRSVHVRAVAGASGGSSALFGAGTRSSATVVSADSRLLLAPIESARPSSDGRAFDLVMSVAETDLAPERPLTRVSLVASDGARSVRVEPGVVADGTTFDDFLAPPQIVAGAAPTGLNEPILVQDFPPGAELTMEVYAGPQLAWVITAPARDAAHARDPIHVPVPLEIRLPALVAASFTAKIDHVPLAPHGEVSRRMSISRDVLFRR